jgi:hypothetical protein
VDVADPLLAEQWQRRSLPNLSFQPGSAYDLPFGDGEFEVATAFEVFEHLERPEEALAELRRVASWGLVLSVPWEPAWRVTNFVAGRYVGQLGNTPGHVNHWTRSGFERFVSQAGRVASVRRPYPWTVAVVVFTD